MSDPPHQAFIVRLLHQGTCSALTLEKEFRVKKKSRTINRSICTGVTSFFLEDIFDHMGAKTIMKRLFSHQNKEKTKSCLKKIEYAKRNGLTDFEILTFFF